MAFVTRAVHAILTATLILCSSHSPFRMLSGASSANIVVVAAAAASRTSPPVSISTIRSLRISTILTSSQTSGTKGGAFVQLSGVARARSSGVACSRPVSQTYPRSPLFFRGGGVIGGGSANTRSSSLARSATSWGVHDQVSDGQDDDELRTGWLHNAEPKQKAQAPGSSSSNGGEMSPAARRLAIEKMKARRNHRIVSPPAFHPCGNGNRLAVTEHKIAVPLTHNDSDESTSLDQRLATAAANSDKKDVEVYFTVLQLVSSSADESFFASLSHPGMSPSERADAYVRSAALEDAEQMILYLQGGPGFGAPAPVSGISMSKGGSWAAEALTSTNRNGKAFDRVVLMDQRGTGRSTPITKQTLERKFPDLFCLDGVAVDADDDVNDDSQVLDLEAAMNTIPDGEPAVTLAKAKMQRALGEATDYMTKFRADSIVRDAELVKEALMLPPTVDGKQDGPKPWGAALGQSFGGFCMMSYLSLVAHPPQICLFTGGIAPMGKPASEVYDRLWPRLKERNLRYYEQYPGDVPRVKRIVARLLKEPATLPSGGKLTARRFLGLGMGLGGSPASSFAGLHSLFRSAFLDDDEEGGNDDELSRSFLKQMDSAQSFDDAPLYYLLHESIYADGPEFSPTNWAAHGSYQRCVAASSAEYEYAVTSALTNASAPPTLFFGEMVFPWMARGDHAELSGYGMLCLSRALASKADWTSLYDAQRMRVALLGGGGGKAATAPPKSRAAAAVYYEDMYVDFECCTQLVRRGMPLEGTKMYVTNEYQHSGLRDDGANIFRKLLGMAKGTLKVPS